MKSNTIWQKTNFRAFIIAIVTETVSRSETLLKFPFGFVENFLQCINDLSKFQFIIHENVKYENLLLSRVRYLIVELWKEQTVNMKIVARYKPANVVPGVVAFFLLLGLLGCRSEEEPGKYIKDFLSRQAK